MTNSSVEPVDQYNPFPAHPTVRHLKALSLSWFFPLFPPSPLLSLVCLFVLLFPFILLQPSLCFLSLLFLHLHHLIFAFSCLVFNFLYRFFSSYSVCAVLIFHHLFFFFVLFFHPPAFVYSPPNLPSFLVFLFLVLLSHPCVSHSHCHFFAYYYFSGQPSCSYNPSCPLFLPACCVAAVYRAQSAGESHHAGYTYSNLTSTYLLQRKIPF